MAEGMVHSQNEINSNVTKTNEKFVELNHELQKERTELQCERISLNEQFEKLEQDRHDLHTGTTIRTSLVRIISSFWLSPLRQSCRFFYALI